MKYLWIVIFVFFTGCSTIQPHILEYKIAPKIAEYHFNSSSCKDKSLKVRRVFSSSELMSQNMRYARGAYEEFFFTESKWAETPNSAITASLVSSINSQNIFANVSSFQSRSRSDLILETRVEDFMQYFVDDANSSYVRVALSTALIDTKQNRVIDSAHLVKKVNVKSLDAKGGVEALNKAFSELLKENNRWLVGACQ